jgi:hypothetical protein
MPHQINDPRTPPEIRDLLLKELPKEAYAFKKVKRSALKKSYYNYTYTNGIFYKGHRVNMIRCEFMCPDANIYNIYEYTASIETAQKNAEAVVRAGRQRRLLENNFRTQKHCGFDLMHKSSTDYKVQKCCRLLSQIADMAFQLFEKGMKEARYSSATQRMLHKRLLEDFRKPIPDDIKGWAEGWAPDSFANRDPRQRSIFNEQQALNESYAV